MQQHEREILVGAFLDMTLGQWETWLSSLSDEAIDSMDHERHVVSVVTSLREKHSGDAVPMLGQQYIQAMAMLSDDNLRQLVVNVSGKDPLTP